MKLKKRKPESRERSHRTPTFTVEGYLNLCTHVLCFRGGFLIKDTEKKVLMVIETLLEL